MCDILVATSKATVNGETIFAKNSDRDPNEAQVIEFIPRQQHDEEKVKLTYVEFPQLTLSTARAGRFLLLGLSSVCGSSPF